jgi:peptide/nickel transport system permease protein
VKNNDRRLVFLATVFGLMMAFVIASPLIFPGSAQPDMAHSLLSPGFSHPFGTDNLGRDLAARSFVGMRLSLALAVCIQLICFVTGAVLGMLSGYFGGVIDKVYVTVQNVFMSFPGLIASLCMIAMLGPGLGTLIIALSVTNWITYARLVRSEVVALKERDFVLGARAVGASGAYLLFRHIMPNVIRPVFPLFTLMIGHTVLSISGLGFLGFGVQPPTAEIGLMVNDGLTYIVKAPWMIVAPGILLAVYVLTLNVLGDALQDRFNPYNELNEIRLSKQG